MFSLFGKKRLPAQSSGAGQRRLYIPEPLYRRMINHCQEERPLEACGLLVGAVDHVVSAYAADNQHRSPVVYKVDDRQLLQVFREIRTDKHEIIGIYHSHVKTEAVPSKTDIDQATWPEAFYVIVSLAQRRPLVRAWRIVDRQVTEHQVVVEAAGAGGTWHDLRQAVQAASEPTTDSNTP